jgi:predicted GNAT family acetyltransferase
MNVQYYPDAAAFLAKTQLTLEKDEVLHSLMYGLSLRLKGVTEFSESPQCFITAEEKNEIVFAGLMTYPFRMVIQTFRSQGQAAMEQAAQSLVANEWPVPGVIGPAPDSSNFVRIWQRLTGEKFFMNRNERLFRLGRLIPPRPTPGSLRLATAADAGLVAHWAYLFQNEALGDSDPQNVREVAERRIANQEIYLWEHGQPVSMAAKTRPTPKGVSVSLVYTPPQFRRKGYASSCVASLSQLLLDRGFEFCALFTDLSNPTSNHIYQEIGYQPVADFNEYRFEKQD